MRRWLVALALALAPSVAMAGIAGDVQQAVANLSANCSVDDNGTLHCTNVGTDPAFTTGNCIEVDANGNFVDSGVVCGIGGSGIAKIKSADCTAESGADDGDICENSSTHVFYVCVDDAADGCTTPGEWVTVKSAALSANASNCSAGSGAGGVTTTGAAEDCTDYIQQSELLDEDTMSSNSATKPASQQSVKAYVDTAVGAVAAGATALDYNTDANTEVTPDGTNIDFDWDDDGAIDMQLGDCNGMYITENLSGTDITTRLQALIDAGDACVASSTGAPNIYFEPGAYTISDTIDFKSSNLIGLGNANNGVRIIWGGTEDVIAFSEAASIAAGGAQLFNIKNIAFVGTVRPRHWFYFTSSYDALANIEGCSFSGTTRHAIAAFGGWYNMHIRKVRFDGIGTDDGCAVYLRGTPTQNMSSFSLKDFTYDNNSSANVIGKGVVCVDVPDSSSSLGTLVIENARIEIAKEMYGDADATGDGGAAVLVVTYSDGKCGTGDWTNYPCTSANQDEDCGTSVTCTQDGTASTQRSLQISMKSLEFDIASAAKSSGTCDTGITDLCTAGKVGIDCAVNADCDAPYYAWVSRSKVGSTTSNEYLRMENLKSNNLDGQFKGDWDTDIQGLAVPSEGVTSVYMSQGSRTRTFYGALGSAATLPNCDGSNENEFYEDTTTANGTLCWCDGSAWQVVAPAGGTCS